MTDFEQMQFEQRLRAAIEQGLPLATQPYLVVAQQLGCSEQRVLDTIAKWQKEGLIRRFGMVVRHRKLGYTANAMVVWDVEPDKIDEIGEQLSAESAVTLCYQRPAIPPLWPYTLFCMIHGKDRAQVLAQLDDICQKHQLRHINKEVLFSTKAYKQRGASFVRKTHSEVSNGQS